MTYKVLKSSSRSDFQIKHTNMEYVQIRENTPETPRALSKDSTGIVRHVSLGIIIKALANQDTFCGHIVADTNVSPFARAGNICCGHKFCVRDTKMFLILFRNNLCPQQMFPSLRSPLQQLKCCYSERSSPSRYM